MASDPFYPGARALCTYERRQGECVVLRRGSDNLGPFADVRLDGSDEWDFLRLHPDWLKPLLVKP